MMPSAPDLEINAPAVLEEKDLPRASSNGQTVSIQSPTTRRKGPHPEAIVSFVSGTLGFIDYISDWYTIALYFQRGYPAWGVIGILIVIASSSIASYSGLISVKTTGASKFWVSVFGFFQLSGAYTFWWNTRLNDEDQKVQKDWARRDAATIRFRVSIVEALPQALLQGHILFCLLKSHQPISLFWVVSLCISFLCLIDAFTQYWLISFPKLVLWACPPPSSAVMFFALSLFTVCLKLISVSMLSASIRGFVFIFMAAMFLHRLFLGFLFGSKKKRQRLKFLDFVGVAFVRMVFDFFDIKCPRFLLATMYMQALEVIFCMLLPIYKVGYGAPDSEDLVTTFIVLISFSFLLENLLVLLLIQKVSPTIEEQINSSRQHIKKKKKIGLAALWTEKLTDLQIASGESFIKDCAAGKLPEINRYLKISALMDLCGVKGIIEAARHGQHKAVEQFVEVGFLSDLVLKKILIEAANCGDLQILRNLNESMSIKQQVKEEVIAQAAEDGNADAVDAFCSSDLLNTESLKALMFQAKRSEDDASFKTWTRTVFYDRTFVEFGDEVLNEVDWSTRRSDLNEVLTSTDSWEITRKHYGGRSVLCEILTKEGGMILSVTLGLLNLCTDIIAATIYVHQGYKTWAIIAGCFFAQSAVVSCIEGYRSAVANSHYPALGAVLGFFHFAEIYEASRSIYMRYFSDAGDQIRAEWARCAVARLRLNLSISGTLPLALLQAHAIFVLAETDKIPSFWLLFSCALSMTTLALSYTDYWLTRFSKLQLFSCSPSRRAIFFLVMAMSGVVAKVQSIAFLSAKVKLPVLLLFGFMYLQRVFWDILFAQKLADMQHILRALLPSVGRYTCRMVFDTFEIQDKNLFMATSYFQLVELAVCLTLPFLIIDKQETDLRGRMLPPKINKTPRLQATSSLFVWIIIICGCFCVEKLMMLLLCESGRWRQKVFSEDHRPLGFQSLWKEKLTESQKDSGLRFIQATRNGRAEDVKRFLSIPLLVEKYGVEAIIEAAEKENDELLKLFDSRDLITVEVFEEVIIQAAESNKTVAINTILQFFKGKYDDLRCKIVIQAAEDGRRSAVRNLVQNNVVKITMEIINEAVESKKARAIKLFMEERFADVPEGVLLEAAEKSRAGTLKVYIQAGLPSDSTLKQAIAEQKDNVVELVVQAGANTTQVMYEAACQDDTHGLEALLRSGACLEGALVMAITNSETRAAAQLLTYKQDISLHAKNLVDHNVEQLAQALSSNTNVISISLQTNFLEELPGLPMLLRTNSTLTQLDLHCNNVSDEAGEALGKALKYNTALIKLNLGRNRLGDKAGASIADALQTNTTLKELCLSKNSLTDASVILLAKALALSQLTTLLLGENKFGDKGCLAICEALEKNRTLSKLRLNSNNLSDTSGSALANALRINCSLTMLGVDKNNLVESIEEIKAANASRVQGRLKTLAV